MDAEDVRRDQALQLRGQLRLAALRVERRVADGLAAERVEARGEVAVRAVGGDERHRGGDGLEEGLVRRRRCRDRHGRGRAGNRGGRRRRWWSRRRRRRRSGGCGDVAVPVFLQQLDEPREAGMGRDKLARAALEEGAPLVRNPVRVLEVLLEQRVGVARVQSVHVVHSHRLLLYQPGSLPGWLFAY